MAPNFHRLPKSGQPRRRMWTFFVPATTHSYTQKLTQTQQQGPRGYARRRSTSHPSQRRPTISHNRTCMYTHTSAQTTEKDRHHDPPPSGTHTLSKSSKPKSALKHTNSLPQPLAPRLTQGSKATPRRPPDPQSQPSKDHKQPPQHLSSQLLNRSQPLHTFLQHQHHHSVVDDVLTQSKEIDVTVGQSQAPASSAPPLRQALVAGGGPRGAGSRSAPGRGPPPQRGRPRRPWEWHRHGGCVRRAASLRPVPADSR